MATYMVKTSEMRQKAALITQGVHAGDSFVLFHYNHLKIGKEHFV